MPTKKAPRRAGGAPQKVPGGLDRALYVRVNRHLMDQLEKLTEARSAAASVVLSKADVARGLIQKAMVDQMRDEERNAVLATMNETDRFEEGWSQNLMRAHITEYFAADEDKRQQVSRLLNEAVQERSDIITDVIPTGTFRHKWPPGLRAAMLALWSKPKDAD